MTYYVLATPFKIESELVESFYAKPVQVEIDAE